MGSPSIGASHSVPTGARNSTSAGGSVSRIRPSTDSCPGCRPCRSRYMARAHRSESSSRHVHGLRRAGPGTRRAGPRGRRGPRSPPTCRRRACPARPRAAPSRPAGRRGEAAGDAPRGPSRAPARPTSAASSPAALRRSRSIWKKRSCACRKPVARATSSAAAAAHDGHPERVALDPHRRAEAGHRALAFHLRAGSRAAARRGTRRRRPRRGRRRRRCRRGRAASAGACHPEGRRSGRVPRDPPGLRIPRRRARTVLLGMTPTSPSTGWRPPPPPSSPPRGRRGSSGGSA